MLERLLFEELWHPGIGWDEQPTEDLQNEWDQWVFQILNLDEVALPQCLIGEDNFLNKLELHVF
ncbi:hypothetical protein HPB48_015862 [Haemaphysalis longicornis]|uniref:Uncharacterized protein n=1 Tax=Haemaphysalis longicornis TaxID=44386 RepID=A0A9J6G7T7_HAELO|nr:hypothetical protein HPB48_015862 [Haemaphysalis longicornis]